MSQLDLRDLRKRFGGVEALSGVSLSVAPGEFCVLLGPSGCGKSTLLRLIAGLDRPSGGRIRIAGRDVTTADPRSRDVAMVFQSYSLYPHMTAGQNMAFPLRVRGVGARERRERVGEAARLLRIEELLGRKPRELSGGERQRVAIGRSIVRRPALFLFDEPLSNLDAQLRRIMRGELARLHRHLRATFVYVTHDQTEAMTLGTRVAVMNTGQFEQVGSPQDLYATPATTFVASFMGSPPINLLRGRTEKGCFVAGTLRWPVPAGIEPAALGVRPEDLVPGDGPWEGRIDRVERLGAETLVHVACGGAILTIRSPGSASWEPGRAVRLRPGRVHLFGADERRLDAGDGGGA